MKRLFVALTVLFAALASATTACADLITPEISIVHQASDTSFILPVALLILAALIVTALLIRHFTKKKK